MRLGIVLSAAALAVAQKSTEPCAIAASSFEKSDKGALPAEVAYNCLTSVPVAVEQDRLLIDQLKTLWSWHSETGYLKNTPESWELGPVDLIGELDKIQRSLSDYNSEYEVQLAIQALTIRTGNFHFNYQPDILRIFSFIRHVAVATISEDGKSVPKSYVAADLLAQRNGTHFPMSPIEKINGQDVEKYLALVASQEQYVDPDARYNSVIYKGLGNSSMGSFMVPTGSAKYHGPWTNITFANGTMRSYSNDAVATQNLTGVDSGEKFFETFCTGEITGVNATDAEKTSRALKAAPHYWKRQSIPTTSYPRPIVQDSTGTVAGYFMTEGGFRDVAVLKIMSFNLEGKQADEFQYVVKRFIGKCNQAGMKKLIIDLRENGGGATHLLLDTFRQLFPTEVPFSAQRYRAQEGYKAIGDVVNRIYSDPELQAAVPEEEGEEGDGDDGDDDFLHSPAVRYWAFWNFVDVHGRNFKDWDSFYGPHGFNHDNLTTNFRYNMSNSAKGSVLPTNATWTAVSGEPAFDAKNIVMLTDGLCGSSCASFHEELKNVAGVKAVVVGGRAQEGAMQTVGGSKGGEVIPMSAISQISAAILKTAKAANLTDVDTAAIEEVTSADELLTRAGDQNSRIQLQDQIRKGDSSGSPLQYIYEAADCRLWYTAKTLFEPQAAWAAAWTAFTDNSKCIKGSTNQSTSISGGYKPYGAGEVKGDME